MDFVKKELIKVRSEALFPVIRDYLNRHYEVDPAVGNAFKFLYLVTYGPRKYLSEFRSGSLKIELEDVRDVYFEWAEYLPGKYGMLDQEVAIVQELNFEIDKYLASQGISVPKSVKPPQDLFCLS